MSRPATFWLLATALWLLVAFSASANAQCVDVCPCTDCNQFDGALCRDVTGSMTIIEAPGQPNPNLYCLETVGQDLRVQGTVSVQSLSVSALRSIGMHLRIVNNAGFTSISAPSLQSVGGHVLVDGNPLFAGLVLPSLGSVGHSISIFQANNLLEVRFPALMSVGSPDNVVQGNIEIRSHLVGALMQAGSIRIYSNSVQTISLQTIGVVRGSVSVSGAPALVTLHVQSVGVVEGSISVQNNPVLGGMSWQTLTDVNGGSLVHSSNPSLAFLHLQSLKQVSGDLVIDANPALANVQLCDVESISGTLIVRMSNMAPEFRGLCGLINVGNPSSIIINTPGICCGFWGRVPYIRDVLGGLGSLATPAVCSNVACPPTQSCCFAGPSPTPAPTAAPTPAPTPAPTAAPTAAPTPAPTAAPTPAPTAAPTPAPTAAPTAAPTPAPTPSTQPLITCPIIPGTPSQPLICGAVVEFDDPVVENVDDPRIEQSLGYASGSLFPVGCTVVAWNIYEGCGALVGTCEAEVCVEDVEVPYLSCPADITAFTEQCSDQFVTVTFTEAIAMGNCDDESVVQTWGRNSGAPFGLGQTLNRWNATDLAGNTNFCEQVVRVLPSPACPPESDGPIPFPGP